MVSVVVRKVDRQGRIVLPKRWREKWGDEVIVVELDDRIEILPKKKPNLEKFFDILEVEVRGEDIEKELLEEVI